MYECLFGYTPFACDDRHKTKLQILKHKQTLMFPRCEPGRESSRDALDLIMQLLVEKEKRLCSRQYHLNDYTMQFVAGRPIKFPTDKHNRNYQGFFVYADDADDLKCHPFFKNIPFDQLIHRRPPFVPRVKDWEDTKYFDDDQPVSDIDDASTDEEAESDGEAEENRPPAAPPGSKASQHHQEDQHIVPSLAIKPSGPLLTPQSQLDNSLATSPPEQPSPNPGISPCEIKVKKTREKKRPRDKILRDPKVGKLAMKTRKEGAFVGYSYRKPKGIQDVIDEVLEAEFPGWMQDDSNAISPMRACSDSAHEKRVYFEASGKVATPVA